MKDSTTIMENNMPPPPFKLERELTLMPSEFRERLSASTRSRKSSAARSAARRSRNERHSATHISKPNFENSNARYSYQNDNDFVHQHNNDNIYKQEFYDENQELNSSSRYYDASHQMTSIGEQENLFEQMERAYSIKTPPINMHMRDLIEPLEDWNNVESIKEKKYPVLPSIGKQPSSPAKSDVTLNNSLSSHLSHNSYSNQLDYGRDKMEQEADFFADYRINTSLVQATPRQNPLPPIESRKSSINGDYSKYDSLHARQVSAGRPAHNNHDFLGLDSMNARQMSGRHKKKSFKF